MTRWLIIILGALGLGAAAGQLENLDNTLPIIGQVVACVAIVVLGVWRGLPDEDGDRVPDALARWPRAVVVLRDWVVPILVAVAAALGVATTAGCGSVGAEAVRYDGMAGEFSVDTTEAEPVIRGSVRNYLTLWGVPVEVEIAYYRGAAAACVRVAALPPVCVKRPLGGGVVIGGAGP